MFPDLKGGTYVSCDQNI